MTKLISLIPEINPQHYYEANQAELDIPPDGTGLQILFKVENDYYVLAGTRVNKVITVNGGMIDDRQRPFLAQLSEELYEETFGVLNLTQMNGNYYLCLKGGESYHPLIFKENHTLLVHKPGQYAYVTFTAICETLTLSELEQLAVYLTPTAYFWNQIGNYLFSHCRKASQEEASFVTYWEIQYSTRCEFIEKLVTIYKQLSVNNPLLIEPTAVFEKQTIEEALQALHDVTSFEELKTLFRHTVGRYSERSGYYVFKASDLLQAVITHSNTVKEIHGQQVAQGVFNEEAVSMVFPILGIFLPHIQDIQPIQAPGNISPREPLFQSIIVPKEESAEALNLNQSEQQQPSQFNPL